MRIKTRLVLTALALLAAAACTDAPQQTVVRAPSAVNVIVEELRYERAGNRADAVGTSRARLSAELFPATSGEVVAVRFEPGQAVKAGDALVELDRRKQELDLRLARLNLEEAERLYDRYLRSADSGAVVPAALDSARAAVETARLELEQARLALSDRTVRAKFDGYVGTTEVDPGDRVNTDTLITTLDDRSVLFVSFEVPEAYIGELAVGDRVRLAAWSTNVGATSGEIVDIGSRIDPRSRSFTARARVMNDEDAYRPGMSFRVEFETQGALYAVVSETGVQWGPSGAYVWSVADGAASRVPVQVVQRRQGRVLIDGALNSGDTVVIEGVQQLRNGTAVEFDGPRLATGGDTPASGVASGGGAAD